MTGGNIPVYDGAGGNEAAISDGDTGLNHAARADETLFADADGAPRDALRIGGPPYFGGIGVSGHIHDGGAGTDKSIIADIN